MESENTKTLFKENIARLRAVNGETQEAVAAALGVTRQAVAKWETGASVPDLVTGAKLAEHFGVTLDDLWRYDEAEQGLPIAPKGKHAFGLAELGSKGEIVLPKDCLALFGLKPGDGLLVLADSNPDTEGIALVPARVVPVLKDFFERAIKKEKNER